MRPLVALLACALVLAGCGDDVEPLRPPAGEEVDPLPDDPPTPVTPEDPDLSGDLSADRWTSFPDAPVALSEVAAAAFGGQVWTAGGFSADGDAVTLVQIFDPAFETWSAGPDIPEAVHHAALVSTGEALYLLGGYTGPGFDAPSSAVRRLDPATGQWEDGPALPQPRAAGAAAWDGQRIVYAGGVGPGGLAGDVYALEGAEWSTLGQLSQPREHLAAASDGRGATWFLAGRTGGLDTNVGTVERVDGADVSVAGAVPTPRGGVAGFWSPGAGACVVGGEQPEGTFGDVECITAEGTVNVLPALEQPRHGLGAAAVEGIVYVVLGGPEPRLTVSGAVEGLAVASP